jgi:hypothetical protein
MQQPIEMLMSILTKCLANMTTKWHVYCEMSIVIEMTNKIAYMWVPCGMFVVRQMISKLLMCMMKSCHMLISYSSMLPDILTS